MQGRRQADTLKGCLHPYSTDSGFARGHLRGHNHELCRAGFGCDLGSKTIASSGTAAAKKSETSSTVKTGWTAGGGVERAPCWRLAGALGGTGDDVTTSVALRTVLGHKFRAPGVPSSQSTDLPMFNARRGPRWCRGLPYAGSRIPLRRSCQKFNLRDETGCANGSPELNALRP